MKTTPLPTYPRDQHGAVVPMTDAEIDRYFGIGTPAPRTVAGTLGLAVGFWLGLMASQVPANAPSPKQARVELAIVMDRVYVAPKMNRWQERAAHQARLLFGPLAGVTS